MVYKTKGTCSSEIEFEVENGILTDIHFVGGCQGNTTGVAALAKGLPIDEVNEDNQTEERISAWAEQVKQEIS